MAGWWSLALVAGMALTNPGDPRNGAPGSDASPIRAGHVDDGTEDASVHTTAEDVLKALQKLRPPNEPISPASAAGQSPAERRHLLWPEGSRLVSRPGRLGRDDRWWTLLLLDNQGETPLRLLPNATLEAVVRSAGQAGPREFVASGEMTVFKGENYLLLRFAMRAAAPVSEPAPPVESARGGEGGPGESGAGAASAEEVLELLSRQRPAQEVMSVNISGAGEPATGDLTMDAYPRRIPGGGPPALSDGSPLIARPGRLVRDGDWWTFVFESDDEGYPEPPMKLLPNQHVELMAEVLARGAKGLVFTVSGEVTAFGGENYLLPRTVMRRVDMGNLRK